MKSIRLGKKLITLGATKVRSATEPQKTSEWRVETISLEHTKFLPEDNILDDLEMQFIKGLMYFLVYRLEDKTLPDCITNRQYYPNVFKNKEIALHIVEFLNQKEKEQRND